MGSKAYLAGSVRSARSKRSLLNGRNFSAFVGKGSTAPLDNGKRDLDAVMVPLVVIEMLNSSSSLGRIGHEDEAAPSSQMVEGSQDDGVLDRAELSKESLELISGGIEREVEDVEIALYALSTGHHCGQIELKDASVKASAEGAMPMSRSTPVLRHCHDSESVLPDGCKKDAMKSSVASIKGKAALRSAQQCDLYTAKSSLRQQDGGKGRASLRIHCTR